MVKPCRFTTSLSNAVAGWKATKPRCWGIRRLAQSGRTSHKEGLLNAFEPVAQSVEHVTFNHGVQGSNPCGLTIIAGY